MGTRGTIGFLVNGKPILTYNHFDSYPDGLGVETVGWLAKNLVPVGDDYTLSAELLGPLHDLEVVDSQAKPTKAQLTTLAKNNAYLAGQRKSLPVQGDRFGYDAKDPAMFLWDSVDTGNNWYAYLRLCQGDLTKTVRSGFILAQTDLDDSFGQDSLFCEWGYVIDVDNKVLDVYEGFKKEAPTAGLWVGHDKVDGQGFHAINRIEQFPFAELIDWFAEDSTGEIASKRFVERANAASRYADDEEED